MSIVLVTGYVDHTMLSKTKIKFFRAKILTV